MLWLLNKVYKNYLFNLYNLCSKKYLVFYEATQI